MNYLFYLCVKLNYYYYYVYNARHLKKISFSFHVFLFHNAGEKDIKRISFPLQSDRKKYKHHVQLFKCNYFIL